jgi:hypothetical protein
VRGVHPDRCDLGVIDSAHADVNVFPGVRGVRATDDFYSPVFSLHITLSAMWSILTRHGYPARRVLEAIMEAPAIRRLIREKLKDGRLPYDGIPRFWGGPSEGEQCDACDTLITDDIVMEGIGSAGGGRKSIQMHIECFALWYEVRGEPRS